MHAIPRPPAPPVVFRRARLLGGTVALTFATLRLWLALTPNADFDVLGYNVHHLFSGVLVVAACSIPLALGATTPRRHDALLVGLGIGLALMLDEWVYLIVTDGTNASYLLPVSFWGGVVLVSAAVVWALVYAASSTRVRRPRS